MDNLPKALLLDLDDTILDLYGDLEGDWLQLCHEFADHFEAVPLHALHAALLESRDWFWSDEERARRGRLDLLLARRYILLRAFARFDLPDSPLVHRMAARYNHIREEAVRPLPGAIETLQRLNTTEIRLGLITNGSSEGQRAKIERFSLAPYFDHIQIEGEFGIGKPDARVFQHALDALGVEPADAWMVGDNLDADIRGAQQVGIYAVWVDAQGSGLPDGSTVRPDMTIRSISDLLV
ncbi:MAG: HAD-IA family hydrolase [Chloroflexi bacterium]|nr:HAD-IA family hydrolase [Chloroflexota bacterium]